MRMSYFTRLTLLALFPLLVAGCGKNGRIPVSGAVTFKGQPLDHGSIQFFTTVGPPGPASGAMIVDGRYTVPKEHGLAAGTYRVVIQSSVPVGTKNSMGASATKERIPPEYSSATGSKHTVEVGPDKPSTFDFDIP